MVDTNLSNFEPALKQIFRQSLLERMVHKRRPLLSFFSKFEGFGGIANLKVPIIYGDPQGVSASLSTAQSNASEVEAIAFAITRPSKYSVATITSEVIEASRGNNMAFLGALQAKINGAVNALANSLETDAFRAGRGGIAVLDASVAPTVANPMVLTLSEIREISCFDVGMVLEASSSDGGTARTTPATATVAAVDRTSGTLTTDYNNAGGSTNWAVNDTLRRQGDDDAVMTGLAGFVNPGGSASFFGVDTTVDSRLNGYAHNATTTGDPIDEALIIGQSKAAQEEGAPDCGFLHHVQWRQLVLRLGVKKEYVQMYAQSAKGMVASVGFRGVQIEGDYGPIDLFPANKCQANLAWLLSRANWSLNTLGPMIKILNLDGLRMLRQAAADGYESRWVSRGNVACNAPGANVKVTLESAT